MNSCNIRIEQAWPWKKEFRFPLQVTASEFRQTASNNNEADGRQQPNSLDSYSTQQRPFSVSEVTQAATTPMLRSVPDPASTRSKVFRHKLQKTLKQQAIYTQNCFTN